MTTLRTKPIRFLARALIFGVPLALLACGGGGAGPDLGSQLLPPPDSTVAALPASDVALYPPYGTQFTPQPYDSGLLGNPSDEPALVEAHVVHVPDAVTLRVIFERVQLGEGSLLEVEAASTGEVQTFTAEEALRWGNTTAHFAGNTLEIRMILAPHAQGSFAVSGVFEGVHEVGGLIKPLSQCGGTDDRVPSADPRSGRLNNGCTMWIEGSNNCAFSAGHCFSGMASPLTFPHVIEFNVPASNGDGSLNAAALRDQYPIAFGTLTFVDDPANSADRPDDWAVARLGVNNLGETAVARQGVGFLIDTGQVFPVFPLAGDPITITGFGVDFDQLSRNKVQQTDTGPWIGWTGNVASYQVDTEGANSGSPVFSNFDGRVIAIHTNAGCGDDGGGGDAGSNSGSGITHPPIVAAHTTVCGKGAPTITGPADQALECDGGGAATPTFLFPTTDPDAEVVLVQFRVDGVLEGSDAVAGSGNASFTFAFPIGGPYVVVATATNATGTQDSHTFVVTSVADTTPPIITCPGDITVECTGPGGTVVVYPPILATDDCGAVGVVAVPPSGTSFPVGTTTVTATATDDVGNTAACSFDVIVQDTLPPLLTTTLRRTFLWLPQNGMVDVGLTATALDACGGPLPVTVTVYSDEDQGVAPYAPDAAITGVIPNQRLLLRAQRDPVANNGRWYIVVVSAVDGAGNAVQQTHVVVVPYNLTTAQIVAIRALANAQLPILGPPPVPPLGSFTLLPGVPFN